MKKVLLVGEIYSENLGDGVLCQCVEFLIKKYFNKEVMIDYLDLSGRKSYNLKPNKSELLLK